MTHLNLEEALECAKNETIYADYKDYDIENKYFTMDMLVDAIIEQYKYPNCYVDTDVQGWVELIEDNVYLNEKDYKEWWKKINDEENDEDIDDEYDKMDEYFTKEYVEQYLDSCGIYNEYEVFSEEELQELYDEEMCNEIEGEYDLSTRIVDFCSFAEQNGYNRNETLKNYVDDVIDAIDGLEVGEEYIATKVNTSQCARHSILKYIYEEILEHKSYLNKIIGTKGMEWECYTDDLDEYEQTMFEKQNLIICRTK